MRKAAGDSGEEELPFNRKIPWAEPDSEGGHLLWPAGGVRGQGKDAQDHLDFQHQATESLWITSFAFLFSWLLTHSTVSLRSQFFSLGFLKTKKGEKKQITCLVTYLEFLYTRSMRWVNRGTKIYFTVKQNNTHSYIYKHFGTCLVIKRHICGVFCLNAHYDGSMAPQYRFEIYSFVFVIDSKRKQRQFHKKPKIKC